MEGLTELIPFLVEEGNSQMWSDFLKTCNELKVFVKKSSEIVPCINSLLNEPKCRVFGLKILEIFLTQCPKSVVSGHVVNWMHQCVKGLIQPNVEQTILSYTVLGTLLQVSIEFPDVRKQTSQVFIPKILDAVIPKLKESRQLLIPVLKCLFACLFHYGKSCGNHKVNLEKVLINLILKERGALLQVSKCFHLLAQTGAPGTESINYKQNWNSQHLILVNSMHFVIDQLFSDVSEILGTYSQCSNEKRKLDLPVVNDDYPFIKSQKLSVLFCGLCQMMETMLLDQFPTSKKIHPELLFGVVCRTLAVTCKSLESKISTTTYAVMSQICDVHIAAIKLLNSLMLCSRTILLPFSVLISKLFVQIFKSTDVENWVQGCERPFSKVRETSYKCLLNWLIIGKSCSFPESQVNSIVDALVKDVKSEKKVVTLNLERKSKSKAAKKISVSESSEAMEMSPETCYAALACIPPLLRVPLHLNTVKRLQEVVTKLIFEIQRELRYDHRFPLPYTNAKCRAMLYSALWALCISPHPRFPPPLHYANILFNSASSDCDLQVQKVCSSAVNSISHMLRPCAPSFEFYVDLDSEIIPINPYPDPSEKRMDNQSTPMVTSYTIPSIALSNEIKPLEKDNIKINDTLTVLNNSEASKNNLPESIVSVSSKIDADEVSEPNIEESIDLDDSSDESLILVDLKENNSSSSGKTKTDLLSNDVLTNTMDPTVEEVLVDESRCSSSRQTRSSSQKRSSEIDLVRITASNSKTIDNASSKKLIESDEVKIIEPGCSSSHSSDSDEIIEISGDTNTSSPKKNVQTLSQKTEKRNEGAVFDSEVIEVDSSTPSKSPKISNSNSVHKTSFKMHTDIVRRNNDDEESGDPTEEVSIIESPGTRRSKRNIKSSFGNSPLAECDDDAQIKRMKISRRLGNEQNMNDVKSDKENGNDEICNVDDDEDMMCSFVDTVPD